MSFVHKGNIEHREKSYSNCKMSLDNRSFLLAFWGLGVRKDRFMIIVQEQKETGGYKVVNMVKR